MARATTAEAIRVAEARGRRAEREWLALPYRLYRDDPCWCPPLRRAERAGVRHGSTGSTTVRLLALDGSRVVGRVACSVDAGLEPLHLSAYEAVDDDRVAAALFGAVTERARVLGRDRLLGPRGRTMFGSPGGLQVAGFDRPVPALAAHHPPYYRRQWEDVGGFRRTGTILSFALDRARLVRPTWLAAADQRATAAGYRSPTFHRYGDLAAHAEAIRRVLNAALGGLPNSLETPVDDVATLIRRLRPIIVPELIRLVLDGDEVIAVLGAMPDLAPALRRSRGRLLPMGWWRVVHERRRGTVLTLAVAGVLPEHQAGGAFAPAVATLFDQVEALPRIRTIEFPLVDATNERSRQFVEGVAGATVAAEYAVYERQVGH